MSYMSADSPKLGEAERYNALVQETSKAVQQFNQVTRSIAQKMTLFGTPQDSRANHQQLTELADHGNKLVAKINRRLQELVEAERAAVSNLRQSSLSFRSDDDDKPAGFDGYNEDQIYAQANVTSYNEDGA
jgi:syntaxin 12/13